MYLFWCVFQYMIWKFYESLFCMELMFYVNFISYSLYVKVYNENKGKVYNERAIQNKFYRDANTPRTLSYSSHALLHHTCVLIILFILCDDDDSGIKSGFFFHFIYIQTPPRTPLICPEMTRTKHPENKILGELYLLKCSYIIPLIIPVLYHSCVCLYI